MCQNTKNMKITPVTDICSKGDFVKKRVLTPSFLVCKDGANSLITTVHGLLRFPFHIPACSAARTCFFCMLRHPVGRTD